MNEEEYKNLRDWRMLLTGVFIGIFFCLIVVVNISAEDNITIINNTYVTNQTFIYNYTINQTFTYNYTINQTINQSTYYNITNITCINCTNNYTIQNISYFNVTNLTCINCSYFNVTNVTNMNLTGGYSSADIDSKIATLQNQINEINKLNLTDNRTVIDSQWATKDTYMSIGIAIAILLALLAIILLFNNAGG